MVYDTLRDKGRIPRKTKCHDTKLRHECRGAPAGHHSLKPQRVLVTGGAELIGRSVVRLLSARGDKVVALVRPGTNQVSTAGVEMAPLDLALASRNELAGLGTYDGVIHLAQAAGWHSFPTNAGEIARVNVAATMAIAEHAVSVGALAMVMASSGGIYGPSFAPNLRGRPH